VLPARLLARLCERAERKLCCDERPSSSALCMLPELPLLPGDPRPPASHSELPPPEELSGRPSCALLPTNAAMGEHARAAPAPLAAFVAIL
jgi:hypothetical protein